MHDAMRRREARDQTVKLAISSATDKNRQMVEDVCGVEIVPSMAIVYEQSKRQRIQQQISPLDGIRPFGWTGDKDTPEEVERLMLRLQALIGWDDFPSDMEFRDVHTQTLFHVPLQEESRRLVITG